MTLVAFHAQKEYLKKLFLFFSGVNLFEALLCVPGNIIIVKDVTE
jgi:hypothetical protein